VQPPITGSIDIRVIVPPVRIAYNKQVDKMKIQERKDARVKCGAHKYGMAEFMPADGEEFERDNH
jgi:hypothetical protein